MSENGSRDKKGSDGDWWYIGSGAMVVGDWWYMGSGTMVVGAWW